MPINNIVTKKRSSSWTQLLNWIDRLGVTLVIIGPMVGLVVAIWLAYTKGMLDSANLTVAIVLWAMTLFAIEGGYHRYFSHCAFKTGPLFEAFLALVGSMSFQGPAIWWASSHRKHHQYSDRSGDPHSPHLRGAGWRGTFSGLIDAHFGWLFREVNSSMVKSEWIKYVPDLLDKPLLRLIHRHYLMIVVLGLVFPALLGGLLTWSLEGAFVGFLWGGLVRIFAVNHGIWAVNSICHMYGSRPYSLYARDRSTNNTLVALATFGAGWHHNHHVFPALATTQMRPWQLDVSGLIIRGLGKLGIVWDVRLPTKRMRHPGWSRSVAVQVARGGAAKSTRGKLTNLGRERAFLETRTPLSKGDHVVLSSFTVKSGMKRTIHTDTDVPSDDSVIRDHVPSQAEAVVEYVAPQGAGIGFVGNDPTLGKFVTSLARPTH